MTASLTIPDILAIDAKKREAMEDNARSQVHAYARELASYVAFGYIEKTLAGRLVSLAAEDRNVCAAGAYRAFLDAIQQVRDELSLVEARPDATVIAAAIVADLERARGVA